VLDQNVDEKCERCGSVLRPNVVWFHEIPYNLDKIQERVEDCTHFIFIGTSSIVYPAAGYKHIAGQLGAKILCIDLNPTKYDPDCDYFIEGKAGEIMPDFVEKWLDS
jgi:NAD-dependent deacetylase